MSLAMTTQERETFLADLHVGIVSIAREGRAPLTVPIWYDYEPGGELWMITDRASLKGKALSSISRISLCVQNEKAPYQYVSVEGPFYTTPTDNESLLAMAVRYLGEDMGTQYASSGAGESSMTVRMTPDVWLTVDYAKQ